MMMFRNVMAAWLLAAAGLAPAGAEDARLAGAGEDADNWLTYGHGWANQRYSALAEIETGNVARLSPAWIYQTGIVGTFPTNPLVVDGVMYLTTPYNHVVALDAATGALRWRYRHELAEAKLCCGSHNRGLAWGYGRLYMVTADARFIALDAASGEPVWDIPMVDPMSGEMADLEAIRDYDPEAPAAFARATRFAGNMAPVVHDGKVFVGVSGTGYSAVLGDAEKESASVLGRPGVRRGLRAFLSAYDADSGRLLWRWYATAPSGWEGEFAATTSFGDPLERDLAAERAARARASRRLASRRWLDLLLAVDRCRTRADLFRYRQCLADLRRSASPRRQSLHLVDRRAGHRQRRAALVPPARAARYLGLRRRIAARAARGPGRERPPGAGARGGFEVGLAVPARPARRPSVTAL